MNGARLFYPNEGLRTSSYRTLILDEILYVRAGNRHLERNFAAYPSTLSDIFDGTAKVAGYDGHNYKSTKHLGLYKPNNLY